MNRNRNVGILYVVGAFCAASVVVAACLLYSSDAVVDSQASHDSIAGGIEKSVPTHDPSLEINRGFSESVEERPAEPSLESTRDAGSSPSPVTADVLKSDLAQATVSALLSRAGFRMAPEDEIPPRDLQAVAEVYNSYSLAIAAFTSRFESMKDRIADQKLRAGDYEELDPSMSASELARRLEIQVPGEYVSLVIQDGKESPNGQVRRMIFRYRPTDDPELGLLASERSALRVATIDQLVRILGNQGLRPR